MYRLTKVSPALYDKHGKFINKGDIHSSDVLVAIKGASHMWGNFKILNDTMEDHEKIKLLVTVEHTSVEIRLDAQGRLFTSFVQADSSTS